MQRVLIHMMRPFKQKITTIVKNELRANTSPLRASLSLAIGLLIGLSPFYGLQNVTVILLAFLFRLNRPLALVGANVSILPLVPFWVAAGIVTGKLTVPLSWCERIIKEVTVIFPPGSAIASVAGFVKKLFPSVLFEKLSVSGHDLAAGFIQWALGSCVLAVILSAVTFAATYPLFLRVRPHNRKTA